MSTIWRHKRGGWYVAVTLPARNRAKIYLGQINKATAQSIASKLDSIMATNRVGEPPTADAAAWLATLAMHKSPLLDQLAKHGLLQQWNRPGAIPTVQTAWDAYVGKRTDYSEGTRRGWRTAWAHVGPRFGSRTLDEITVADAKDFTRDLCGCVASTHARQILNRLRMVFADAIDAGVITSSPFADCKISAKTDKTRYQYISEETASQVLEAFGSLDGRALFALARWCGLRVPHEPLAIKWTDIDWSAERLIISANTKTGHRVVPLFPVALEHLRVLQETAPTGAVYVFNRGRASAATEWRRWLEDAIRHAKLQPWPHLWHNLRRSCRTDLEDRFPSHVCDAWIGHSAKVAKDHYLLVTAEHWQAARTAREPRARRGARRAKG